MKNIFGKMKKLACLGLAVLTVVSAAGCMVKKEWKISKADLAKVNKLAKETFNEDFMKDCESVYVDAFLSGTDEEYLSDPVYQVGDYDNRTPKAMLKSGVREKCPFTIDEIEVEDCNNYSEKEKTFDVTVRLNVIDFTEIFKKLITEGVVVFKDTHSPDDPNSKDFAFYDHYKGFYDKTYYEVLTDNPDIDKGICACGFLIEAIEKSDKKKDEKIAELLSDCVFPTEIVLKVKEVKGKFEIVPSKDKIDEDVKEQIKLKFID